MRASSISSSACEKLLKVRVERGSVGSRRSVDALVIW